MKKINAIIDACKDILAKYKKKYDIFERFSGHKVCLETLMI